VLAEAFAHTWNLICLYQVDAVKFLHTLAVSLESYFLHFLSVNLVHRYWPAVLNDDERTSLCIYKSKVVWDLFKLKVLEFIFLNSGTGAMFYPAVYHTIYQTVSIMLFYQILWYFWMVDKSILHTKFSQS